MPFQMSNKVIFAFARVITFVTCEWFSRIVYLLVFSQVASCYESLVAYLTEEGFLSRMLPGMDNQLCIRYPPPTARIAFKRTIVCVRHQVFSEIATM